MKRSSNNVFRIALAVSIAIHLVLLSFAHSKPVTAAPQQRPQRTEILVIHRVKPTPRPTPTPQPAHPKTVVHRRTAHAHFVRPHLHVVHQTSSNKQSTAVLPAYKPHAQPPSIPGPGDIATATAGPIATDVPNVPTPTPKPACSAPDVPAKALDAVTPESPPDLDAASVTAKIQVDLDAAGAVTGASVYASTGYPQLDRAALQAARESRYAPEERHCKNVAGSYLFTVDFSQ